MSFLAPLMQNPQALGQMASTEPQNQGTIGGSLFGQGSKGASIANFALQPQQASLMPQTQQQPNQAEALNGLYNFFSSLVPKQQPAPQNKVGGFMPQ